MSVFNVRLLVRQDTLANWIQHDPVLRRGELAMAFDDGGEHIETKLGTGATWINTSVWEEQIIATRFDSSDDIVFYYDTASKTYKFELADDITSKLTRNYLNLTERDADTSDLSKVLFCYVADASQEAKIPTQRFAIPYAFYCRMAGQWILMSYLYNLGDLPENVLITNEGDQMYTNEGDFIYLL